MDDSSHDDPNTLRILVVGESKVGKTLFIRRLCYDVFDFSRSNQVTNSLYWDYAWPPTIGFAIDVLVRDAHIGNRPRLSFIATPRATSSLASDHSVDEDRLYGGIGDSFQRAHNQSGRRRKAAISPWAKKKAGRSSLDRQDTPLTESFLTQTIEFYELGGMHTFGPGAMLPLQGIRFDGIIFVYNRANVRSSINLNRWYTQVREFLLPAQGGGPRMMLLGALLKPVSDYLPINPSLRKHMPQVNCLPDEMLLDPSVRLQVWHRMGNTHPSSSSSTSIFLSTLRENVFIRHLREFYTALRERLSLLRIFLNPSLVLSEMFQEERGDVCFRPLIGKIEWCAKWMLWVEHIITFWMTVLLFGVPKSSWREPCDSSKAVLNRIREGHHCIVHIHICHLYDRIAFESSVDEITSFFDILHHNKITRYHRDDEG